MKRIIAILLSIILGVSALSSCGSRGSAGSIPGSGGNSSGNGSTAPNPKIDSSVIDSNSRFAFDIFKKLNGEDSGKNIFISPMSISTVLTMVYNGAETTTKEAMAKALRYDNIDRGTVDVSYKNLLDSLKNTDKNVELDIANSIWIRDGEKINEPFISNNKSNFNAEVRSLDFSKDSASGTINKWISDSTKGKISKMIDPPIDKDVCMYLINATYFKGQWSEKFDPGKTVEGTFKALDGNEQTVSMMTKLGNVQFADGDDYKAVKLPYGSGKVSMYCILPDEGININDFIKNMSFEKWSDMRKKVSETDNVMLQIPKFRIDYGIKNLNDSLESLGMGEAFTDRADFSGIRENVCISRVLHKAVIDVDENGSEAAASTVGEVRDTALAIPLNFTADRPFMFIIADDTTGTILFMGKLLKV